MNSLPAPKFGGKWIDKGTRWFADKDYLDHTVAYVSPRGNVHTFPFRKGEGGAPGRYFVWVSFKELRDELHKELEKLNQEESNQIPPLPEPPRGYNGWTEPVCSETCHQPVVVPMAFFHQDKMGNPWIVVDPRNGENPGTFGGKDFIYPIWRVFAINN